MFASALLFLLLGQAPVPASFETLFQRGLEALASGQLEAAEAAFREAEQLEPQNPGVHHQLGEVLVRRARLGEGLGHFRKAIQLAPQEPQFYFRLAVLQAQLGRSHDAYQTLNELLRVRPDYPETFFLLGRVAEEQGDHALAERHLRQYLQLQPEDPKGIGELGVVLLAQDKYPEAERLLKQALARDPTSGVAHYNLGLLYSRQGQHEPARRHLEAATRLLPGNAAAHYQLGNVLARLDEIEEAEESFRRALELAPDDLESRYALGTLLRRLGRSEEAAQVLAEHERLSAAALEERQRVRRVSAYHLDVQRLLGEDRLEAADKKLDEILLLDPQNDLAYYRRAQILFLRQNFERARDTVQAAIKQKDFEPAYHLLQGMCWERLGQDEKAALAYERVVSLADYADAYWALSRIELRRGNIAQAVIHLRRAVALEPENPDLRVALAEALEKAGDPAESQQQRNEAEQLRRRSPEP